jgi:hypothetical protein
VALRQRPRDDVTAGRSCRTAFNCSDRATSHRRSATPDDFDVYRLRGETGVLGLPAQDFAHQADVKYENNPAAAMAQAKALNEPGRRMLLLNMDTGDWSEIFLERGPCECCQYGPSSGLATTRSVDMERGLSIFDPGSRSGGSTDSGPPRRRWLSRTARGARFTAAERPRRAILGIRPTGMPRSESRPECMEAAKRPDRDDAPATREAFRRSPRPERSGRTGAGRGGCAARAECPAGTAFEANRDVHKRTDANESSALRSHSYSA